VTCEERSGLLFAHACDRPSLYGCTVCGKAICIEHTRMSASGPTCIACVATAEPGTDSDDDPYFYRHGRDDYHSRSYYDADDRDAFENDTTDDASDSAAEGDLGAS
jgi:hypothetical protein